jgi:hypothetical protein
MGSEVIGEFQFLPDEFQDSLVWLNHRQTAIKKLIASGPQTFAKHAEECADSAETLAKGKKTFVGGVETLPKVVETFWRSEETF